MSLLSLALLKSGFVYVDGACDPPENRKVQEDHTGPKFTYDILNGFIIIYDEDGDPWLTPGYNFRLLTAYLDRTFGLKYVGRWHNV